MGGGRTPDQGGGHRGLKALFCTDGSPCASAALSLGARLLRDSQPEATVLYVVPELGELLARQERLHEEELREIEQLFGDTEPDVEVVRQAQAILQEAGLSSRRRIRQGDPAEEILTEIREGGHELVVLGSHGLGLSEVLLGSVSTKMMEESPVPVMLLRIPGAED
ncbi:MAG: universal stress protein [Deltaproteobacteria bacterium]|nr:universal stress protein [Deltaproteobacteria bacterium]